MKKIILLFVFAFSLFLVNDTNALLFSNAAWDDNSDSKTINYGDDAIFTIESIT